MSKGQKIVTIALWTVLVIVMVAVIGAGAWDGLRGDGGRTARNPNGASTGLTSPAVPPGKTLDKRWPAPPFALTDQNDQPFTDRDLQGHPYIADFVFTQCAGPCPLITGKMAQLQKMVNPAVHLVSFSVDPQNDTPAALKEYAAKFNVDPARWHFLTGKPEAVYAVTKGMKISAQAADAQSPIIHSTQLMLIDGEGQVRGIYGTGEHADPDTLNRLTRDADSLVHKPR